jgi:hypothetical protein
LVFDYLRMTGNSRRPYPPSPVQVAPVGWNGFAVVMPTL